MFHFKSVKFDQVTNTMIVYLIQPGYCHGTNRYKIGMSEDESLTRVARGYPKNSTIFCIAGTFDNPRVVENDLIQCFCNRFKTSECGREYFEGSLREMIGLFNATVDKHRKYNEDDESSTKDMTFDNTKKIVEYIDDTSIKCLKCHGTYHPGYNIARHLQTCQNIPLTTCEFCLLNFSSKQSKCNHRKNCKQKQRLVTTLEQGCGNVIHNMTNKDNKVNDFGNEDLTKLLSSSDPRLDIALKSFADTIQLIYFNKDCPENQTVRKLVKRDHSMEVMENNQWKPMLCSQGIPMLREYMGSRIKEHMNGHTFFEKITDSHVRELLYNHTKHREVSTDTILSKVKLFKS